LPFTPGVPSIQTITVSGYPAPQICVSSGNPPLPADFSLNGGMCGQNGRFELAFNGNPGSTQRTYKLTLAASNGTTANPVLQTFTVDVSEKLAITSPILLTGTAAFPVNFQVTATGIPPLSLSVTPSLLDHFPGLKFVDNGNGTGTISGTSLSPGHWACLYIDGRASCGVVATNSQGTIIQGFGINLVPAPAATLGLPAQATFIAGASNLVKVPSIGASTHVSWNVKSAPPWLVLIDNGDSTATLLGNPPAGTSGTFTAEIAPIAAGSAASVSPVFTPFLVTVVNQPLFLSPNTATFTVGSEGSFAISASEGNIGISDMLPAGLSFTGGNPAHITGTPVPGTGGQYQFNVTDTLPTGVSIYGSLVLNVQEAPSIISGSKANFPSGLPGSFTVTTLGFPSASAQPLAPPLTPPTGPNQGKGMYFTVTGLPVSLKASNLDSQGYATGALTIEGTPSAGEAGTYKVQIMARNGVGATAEQNLILKILKLASVPPSGTECFGAYTGVFTGDIGVSAGQNCMFLGGRVIGNITVIGGDLVLSRARVTGNVQIQGWSEFSIDSGSEIGGDLTAQDLTLNFGNGLCASRVAGNVSVLDNAIPIEIGSPQSSCPGNIIGGNLAITNNWDSIDVYNNQIARTLSCSGNLSIAGGNNPAQVRQGQCISF
jgi:Putative Ig domain